MISTIPLPLAKLQTEQLRIREEGEIEEDPIRIKTPSSQKVSPEKEDSDDSEDLRGVGTQGDVAEAQKILGGGLTAADFMEPSTDEPALIPAVIEILRFQVIFTICILILNHVQIKSWYPISSGAISSFPLNTK